jgi:hypothetical protein
MVINCAFLEYIFKIKIAHASGLVPSAGGKMLYRDLQMCIAGDAG